jgi:surfactin synthase thioesterase subunit
MSARRSPWFVVHARRATPRLRLYCFPYAGGAASVFRSWAATLPDEIEVVAVQLPGREMRFHEPLPRSVAEVVHGLVDAIAHVPPVPFASFGHSLGTLLSYEWTLALERAGLPTPLHMIMSGRGAPHVVQADGATHRLPDREFIQTLRDMQGTPEELLQDDEAMRVLLPQIRADFALAGEHSRGVPWRLPCGLSVYGGLADSHASSQALLAWQACSANPIRVRQFPGGHFFLHSARHAVLGSVVRDLWPFCAATAQQHTPAGSSNVCHDTEAI